MHHNIKNLVFEGGGILSIAYLGALDYLDEIDILPNIEKVAGSSSGALIACLTCFNTSITDIKKMASTLDHNKIIQNKPLPLRNLGDAFKKEFEHLFGNINFIYRLINNYGLYSTDYIYNWTKKIIEDQFDKKQKKPPYTFADFKNNSIHRNNIDFKDLYIVGTDISSKSSVVFSYETTPNMEVAQAIRISMAIPLLFEAVKIENQNKNVATNYIFADGGIMRNYPINLFDHNGINYNTLGMMVTNKTKYRETKNLIGYISNLFITLIKTQEDIYNNDKHNQMRTININTCGISSLDFDISIADQQFLYKQGYEAALDYFDNNRLIY
jgi:NTE family protein